MKKLLAIILSGIICVSFTSCAKEKSEKGNNQTTAVEETTTVSINNITNKITTTLNSKPNQLFVSSAKVEYDYWGKFKSYNLNVCQTADQTNLKYHNVLLDENQKITTNVGQVEEFSDINLEQINTIFEKIEIPKLIEKYKAGAPVYFQASFAPLQNENYIQNATSSVTTFLFFDSNKLTETTSSEHDAKRSIIIYPFYENKNKDGTKADTYSVACEVVIYF